MSNGDNDYIFSLGLGVDIKVDEIIQCTNEQGGFAVTVSRRDNQGVITRGVVPETRLVELHARGRASRTGMLIQKEPKKVKTIKATQ